MDGKLASLRAELDRESATRRGRDGELVRLRRELEKGRSEFEKDSELQAVFKVLGAAD